MIPPEAGPGGILALTSASASLDIYASTAPYLILLITSAII